MDHSIMFERKVVFAAAFWLGCGGCTLVEDLMDRIIGTDGDVGVAPTCPDDPSLAGWSPVGILGLDDQVLDLAAADESSPIGPALYACGDFLEADGIVVNHVAKWDGNVWSALSGPDGTGVDATCHTVAISPVDGLLHVGGAFETAGGETAFRYAVWDGSAWAAGPVSFDSGAILDIEFADITGDTAPEIVVGGSFHDGGLLLFNGLAWLDSALNGAHGNLGPFPDVGIGEDAIYEGEHVEALHTDGNQFYVGGKFTAIGGLAATNIAELTSLTSFVALEDGLGFTPPSFDGVHDLATYFGDLYAGGFFLSSGFGAIPAEFLARWDGKIWSGAGIGTDSSVEGLLATDIGDGFALYAAGDFNSVGGTPPNVAPTVLANFVARFEGGVWSSLDDGLGPEELVVVDENTGYETVYNNLATTMTSWGDGDALCLYVGGRFQTADELDVENIARWCCRE